MLEEDGALLLLLLLLMLLLLILPLLLPPLPLLPDDFELDDFVLILSYDNDDDPPSPTFGGDLDFLLGDNLDLDFDFALPLLLVSGAPRCELPLP